MKRGVVVLIGVVFLVLFGVFAFLLARSGNKTVTTNPVVKVWAPFDEKKVYDQLFKGFVAANPGVTVEFRYVEAADAKEYEAKVVDAIASGTGPDVWLIRTDWLPKHAPKLTTMPKNLGWQVQSREETEDEALKRIYSPAVINLNSYQGGLYGLPLAVDSLALYINEDALDLRKERLAETNPAALETLAQYPRTWAELETWVRFLTVRERGAVSQPALALGTLGNTYAPIDVYTALVTQFGGQIYNSPDEVALHLALGDGSIPGTRALELFTSFSNPAHPNYTWSDNSGDPVRKFAVDELPMLIAYSTLEPQLLKIDSEISNITVVPLPQRDKIVLPTDERVDFAAYWTHVVPKASSNQLLAWKLIQYLTGSESQEYYEEQTLKKGYMSIDRSTPAVIDETGLSQSMVFARQVLNARPVLKPEWQFVDERLQTMIQAVRAGALSAQAAVDTAAQQLKEAE